MVIPFTQESKMSELPQSSFGYAAAFTGDVYRNLPVFKNITYGMRISYKAMVWYI
jgi:hypothetical protein